MKQPDAVLNFKRELSCYEYKLKQIKNYEIRIEEIYDRLGGVRAIDPSKEPIHSPPDKDLEYALRNQISKYETRKDILTLQIREIDEILARIEKPLCSAVISVYAKGNTIALESTKLNLSETGLRKRMNKAIEKALID